MFGLIKIVALTLTTLAGMVLLTVYEPDGFDSVAQVFGIPVVSVAQEGAVGVVAVGQVNATGALVVGQNGWGLVAFVQGGVGLFFALGQGVFGLIAIGQLALAVSASLGQIAISSQALGQVCVKKRDYSIIHGGRGGGNLGVIEFPISGRPVATTDCR